MLTDGRTPSSAHPSAVRQKTGELLLAHPDEGVRAYVLRDGYKRYDEPAS